jgi:hypothetical protein
MPVREPPLRVLHSREAAFLLQLAQLGQGDLERRFAARSGQDVQQIGSSGSARTEQKHGQEPRDQHEPDCHSLMVSEGALYP